MLKKSALHLAVLAISTPALAQEVPPADLPTVELDPIVVYIKQVNGYNIAGMTGLDLSLKDIPQSVSVVDKKAVKDLHLNKVEDAIAYGTGVNVFMDTGRPRFQSRGFTMDSVQEDGISNTLSDSYNYGTLGHSKEMSDMAFYQHAEVLRGVAGLSQSIGNPGGTVNLVRKKPSSVLSANAQIAYGTDNHQRVVGDVSVPVNDALRTRLIATYDKKDSFKDGLADKKRMGVMATVQADLSDKTTLNAGLIYQKDDGALDLYGVPVAISTDGTIATKQAFEFDRKSYFGLPWTKDDYKKYNLFADLNHRFNDDWQASLKANYTDSQGVVRFGQMGGVNPYYAKGNTHTLRRQYYENTGHEFGAKLDVVGRYGLFGNQHDVFISASHSNDRYTHLDTRTPLVNTSFETLDRTTAEPNWHNHSELSYKTKFHNQVKQSALVLGTRLQMLDNLHLTLGARHTRLKEQGSNVNLLTQASRAGNPTKRQKTTPYVGINWAITPQHTWYASYTEMFRPQTALKKDGTPLEDYTGATAETGVKSTWQNNRLNSSIALYQTYEKNRAIADPTDSNYRVADGEIRSRGVDLELNGMVNPNWHIGAGYTFNKNEYVKTENTTAAVNRNAGEPANRYSPKHMLRLYSTYRLPQFDKLTLGTAVRYQSQTTAFYNDHLLYATIPQKPYVLWDATAKYELSDSATLGLAIKNITDKKYFYNTQNRTAGMNNFYGEPRSVMVSLDYQY